MRDKPFVVVSGNIGTGKSTLAKLLGEEFGWEAFKENTKAYIYLSDFYEDMSRWSFNNQLQFIIHKFRQQEAIKSLPKPACQDRSVYECYEVFSRKLFDDGLMSPRDFQCLTDVYTLVLAYLPLPDLIVHLKAPVRILLDRIKQRDRAFERGITLSYLADLEQRYDDWVQSITFCPVSVTDTGQVDYVRNLEDRKSTLVQIASTLGIQFPA